jgi:hypothetical protein
VRLTIFVVPRPAPVSTVRPPAPAPRGAPFLTARAVPRLDRRRRTRVRLACDQDCSLAVRLTARLRSGKKLTGPLVRRSIAARGELALRLRLPARPRGSVKTAWITGRVRNAAGQARSVRLPVRRPR